MLSILHMKGGMTDLDTPLKASTASEKTLSR